MIPPTPTTLTTMPGSKAKIGFSIDSIVGEEVSKSSSTTTTTTTKDRNDFKYVSDYQTEIARALRLSDSFGADGHVKFRPELNGSHKEARHLFGSYSMKRESSLSPSAPYTTQTALPSEESSMRKSRTPSPIQAAQVLTNNNNSSSNNNNNNNSNNNNLHTSGSNTNNNEPPVIPSLAFTVSLTEQFIHSRTWPHYVMLTMYARIVWIVNISMATISNVLWRRKRNEIEDTNAMTTIQIIHHACISMPNNGAMRTRITV